MAWFGSGSSNNSQTSLEVDLALKAGQRLAAEKDQQLIAKEAELALLRQKALSAQRSSRHKISASEQDILDAQSALAKAQKELTETRILLNDWMQATEAFKRLSTKYGRQKSLSNDQINSDLQIELDLVRKENPNMDIYQDHNAEYLNIMAILKGKTIEQLKPDRKKITFTPEEIREQEERAARTQAFVDKYGL